MRQLAPDQRVGEMQPNLGPSFSPLACVVFAVAIGIAAAAIVRAFHRFRAGPQTPDAAPATPELRPEGPAVANFLVHGARVGIDAYAVAFGIAQPTLRIPPPRVAPPPLEQPKAPTLTETNPRADQ